VNLYDHTGLGRPLDLRLPSNRIAVLLPSLAGAVTFAVLFGSSGAVDLFAAGRAGVGVFLAWAVARELDPDRPRSATIAALLAGLGLLLGLPAPGVAAVVLLAARVLVGTVGSSLRPADLAVLLGAAAYAGTRPEAWPAGVLLAVAVVVARAPRGALAFGAMASAGAVAAALSGALPTAGMSVTGGLVAVAAVLATTAATPVHHVAARTDVGRRSIDPRRVTAARIGAGLAVVAGAILSGDGAALVPVAAALAGAALVPTRRQPVGRRRTSVTTAV
jgi:hypothetical protein